jgi:hypothetical protein
MLRMAVLIEAGHRADAAVAEAAALAGSEPASTTLVAVVPHARGRGCAVSPTPLNEAIEEAAGVDLWTAGQHLGVCDRRILRDGLDPSLPEWVAAEGFDLVLLPRRRRRVRGGHPQAARLRNVPGLAVRVL